MIRSWVMNREQTYYLPTYQKHAVNDIVHMKMDAVDIHLSQVMRKLHVMFETITGIFAIPLTHDRQSDILYNADGDQLIVYKVSLAPKLPFVIDDGLDYSKKIFAFGYKVEAITTPSEWEEDFKRNSEITIERDHQANIIRLGGGSFGYTQYLVREDNKLKFIESFDRMSESKRRIHTYE
jgi:hypothetical protein